VHPRPTDSRGSATAETAVLLPVLVVVLAGCVWALACVFAQLQCVDAARAAARAAARGDTPAAAHATGTRLAPRGAEVSVRSRAGTVEVRVAADVAPFGGVLRVLPAIAVSGRATAAVEPGAAP
jgi:Flp pilus assembly protein TadG